MWESFTGFLTTFHFRPFSWRDMASRMWGLRTVPISSKTWRLPQSFNLISFLISKPAFQVGVLPVDMEYSFLQQTASCFALSQEIVPGSSGGLFKVPALGFDHSCRSLTPLGGFLSAGLKHIEAYKFSEIQIALGKYSMYSPSRWLNACDIMWLSKLNVSWM